MTAPREHRFATTAHGAPVPAMEQTQKDSSLRRLSLGAGQTSSTARATGYSLTSTVVQGGVRFLSGAAIGRIGGPEVLGTVAPAIALAQLCSLLWPTSVGAAASKFVARSRGEGDTNQARAVAQHLRTRTIQSASLLSVIAGLIWWKYSHANPIIGAITVAVLIFGYSGYAYARGIQYGARHFRRSTLWDLLTATLGLVGTVVVLVVFPPGIVSILPVGLAYCLFTISGRTHPPREAIRQTLRGEIDRFTALGVIGTLASAGFLQLAQLVANVFLSTSEAGNFSAATTLATPMSLIAGSVTIALYPTLAEAWGRHDIHSFRNTTDVGQRSMLLLLVALFSPLIIASPLLSRIAWGTQFRQTPTLLPIMLLAVLLTSCGAVSTGALTTRSNRGMRLSALGSLSGMVVGVLAWSLLIPHVRVYGVAVGYAAGAAVICLVPLVAVWRSDRHRWWGPHVTAVLAISAMFVCYLVARNSPLPELLLAVIFPLGWLLASIQPLRRLTKQLRGEVKTLRHISSDKQIESPIGAIPEMGADSIISGRTRVWMPSQHHRSPFVPTKQRRSETALGWTTGRRRAPVAQRVQKVQHTPLLRALLFVLPTTAAFGSLIPGISQLFAFRIVALVVIATALLTNTPHAPAGGGKVGFTLMAIVWATFGVSEFFFVSDRTAALRSLMPVLLGLCLLAAVRHLSAIGPVLRPLRHGWLIAFIITGILGFWESATGHHFSNYLTQGNGAPPVDLVNVDTRLIASVFGNPNAYGTFLVAVIPMILFGLVRNERRAGRGLHLVLLLAALALLVLTGGRLCMFAVMIEIIIFTIYVSSRRTARIIISLVVAALVFTILATAFSSFLPAKVTQFNIQTISSHLTGAAGTSGFRRIDLYRDGVAAVWQSNGLGLGPGGFETLLASGNVPYPTAGIGSPHNAYLEIAADYSALTLILVIAWLIVCSRRAVALTKTSDGSKSAWGAATISSLAGFAIAALANSTFLPSSVNWTWLATVMAVSCLSPGISDHHSFYSSRPPGRRLSPTPTRRYQA